MCVGAIICKSKNKWYYDVGKHKAHPLLLLLLCLAACFLGRPYDYWEVYGIKPWARKFYNSKEWEQCRQAYIAVSYTHLADAETEAAGGAVWQYIHAATNEGDVYKRQMSTLTQLMLSLMTA